MGSAPIPSLYAPLVHIKRAKIEVPLEALD